MRPARSIRRLAASAVAFAALATGLLAAAPAQADSQALPVVRLTALPTVALPSAPATVQPNWSYRTNASSLNVDDAVISVDFSGLAHIAKVSFSENCTVAGTVATCTEFLDYGAVSKGETFGSQIQMTLKALKSAKLGSKGSYTVSGTSSEATIVGRTGTVVVGGPALSLDQPPSQSGVAVGSTVSEPVRFTNSGDRPAPSVKVLLRASPGLVFATHYANCTYGTAGDPGVSTDLALCTVAGPIQVGEVAELADPVQLQVTQAALLTYLDIQTFAPGDATGLSGITWTQGSGDTLALTVIDPGQSTTAPAGRFSTSFPDNESNYQIASVQADNTADFGVTGSSASASAGATATFDFTGYAAGPATLFDRSGGELVPGIVVTPPPGTTVVSSSSNCQPWQQDNPDATAHGPYVCGFNSFLIPAGTTADFSLTVHVDTSTPGAQGSVALFSGPSTGSPSPYTFPYDPNTANDTAVLALN
jgi:hypothetical protein